jgi:phosphatidylserine decarboxylase
MGAWLVWVLVACGGGGSVVGDAPSAPTRIEIAPNALLLTATGQKKSLAAKVFDAAGNIVQAPVEWTSSHPETIAVDASGVVTAIGDGSSQIIARIGTVQSPPLLAVHTQLPAEAVLLTDANIVGEPGETTPGAVANIGNTYQVQLTGLPAPEVGSLLINTEGKVVGGRVNMSEAANPDVASYASFNDFFTRALKAGARPLAQATLICPVDGAISQFGRIEGQQIFQAKGHQFSSTALVGGDAKLAAQFDNGHFATLYLSPRDYHRIHMPCAGRLTRMIYVPGDLFSVNPATARGVPGLFARNERVVCVFEGADGPFVLVLVGATIVGSMATTWHGAVNAPRPGKLSEWHYENKSVTFKQGDEMGRFLLGSTVVMLFPKSPLQFNPAWQSGRAVQLGQVMAQRV